MILLATVYLIKENRLENISLSIPGMQYLWALCGLGFISAFVNNNETGIIIAMILAVTFLIGAFTRSVMTRKLFNRITEVSCAASLFSFVAAMIQLMMRHNNRVCSVFMNANYYAAIVETVVLFAVYQLLKVKTRKQKWFYLIVISLNSVGLYLTGCRTAVFALCAAALVMFLFNNRYKALAFFIGFCMLLGILIIGLPYIFPRMSNVSSDLDGRIEIWRMALNGILSHPFFGEGAMSFTAFNIKIYGASVAHAHSIYLEPLLSFGIIGTGMILIYLKKNLTPILKMRNIKDDRDKFALASGLLLSVLLHGVVDATAFGLQTGILLLISLAMAGIQENTQSAFVLLSVSPTVYQQSGQTRAVYPQEEKSLYSK